jgi:CrcB protein
VRRAASATVVASQRFVAAVLAGARPAPSSMKVVLIAIAGAAGALTRYGIATAIGVRSFPWATLAINLTGSFLLGTLITAGIHRGWPENVVIPLSIGFLGAYTTFSTFSYETFTLGRADRFVSAALYVAVSVTGGILAACAGYLLAKRIA